MMTKRAFHIIFLTLMMLCSYTAFPQSLAPSSRKYLDSVLAAVSAQARLYSALNPDFQADIYARGQLDIKKRNRLMKLSPTLRKAQRGVNRYYAEVKGNVTFTNPNIFNQDFEMVTTNTAPFVKEHIESIVSPTVRINPYATYFYGNLYSPVAEKARRHYHYRLDNIFQHDSLNFYRISFRPKYANYKLTSGYMVVCEKGWTIRELYLEGNIEFVKYTNYIRMGEMGTDEEYLPTSLLIQVDIRLLGNHVSGVYTSRINYKSITRPVIERRRGIGKYDLSLHYNTSIDTLRIQKAGKESEEPADTLFVDRKVAGKGQEKVRTKTPFTRMSRFLVQNKSFNLKNLGKIKLYPIISPIMFDYSTRNGLSYAQKLKYSQPFKDGRSLYVDPKIGYNFKFREFYWRLDIKYHYVPQKRGYFSFDIGNSEKISTERIRDQINSIPHAVLDTNKLNLRNFRTSYLRFGHEIEVLNGFTVRTGFSFLKYNETEKSDFSMEGGNSLYQNAVQKIARHSYVVLEPDITLQWTPHQYFYMDGNRKVYLYSRFPTFTLAYAYAINGIFNSNTSYHKLEADMTHAIQLSPAHHFYYRVGAGGYLGARNLFFTQFRNLRRKSLPLGWNDDIGGTFQTIRRPEYNAINWYARVNVRYDAPFLLSASFLRNVKYITKERLYCNFLVVNNMKPYIELGYGIGTSIFNVGLFWGGEIDKWNRAGVKFTFELFND